MTSITRLRAPESHLTKLYINDIPIHSVARVEQLWDNVQGAPELIGEPIHVPLRPGTIDIPQVPGAREIGFSVVLFAADSNDVAEFNQIWDELAQLIWSPRTPVVLRRDVEYPGDVIVSTQCMARYVSGLSPSKYDSAPGMGKLVLRFKSLDPYWYAITPDQVTQSTSGGISVSGMAETRRATITFHGGTNPTFTNMTTGVSVTYTGSPGTLVLDVENFTALNNGSNVVGYVTHSGDVFWSRFVPGTNSFTISGGGTVSVSVTGAYL